MILSLEELKELPDELIEEYKAGLEAFANREQFSHFWSETKKEGYIDACQEITEIIRNLYANLFGLEYEYWEPKSKETINATNE